MLQQVPTFQCGTSEQSACTSHERCTWLRNTKPYTMAQVLHVALNLLGTAVLAHALAAWAMAFVPPEETSVRMSVVIGIAGLAFSAIGATDRATDEGQSYAEYMFGFILHANCFLVLLNLEAPQTIKGRWQRLRWACIALFTPRRDLPQDPRASRSTSSRPQFVLKRILEGMACGTLYYYLRSHSMLPFRVYASDISPHRDSLILQILQGTLTTRSFLVRAETTLFSILMPILILNTIHALVSAVFVALTPSSPSAWPPLFGKLTDAYTVRRWYSHFWEKLMRKGFTINAAFLAKNVLGLEPHTTPGRSSVVMLSFLLSGIMHTAAGWTPGPCANWRPLWSYLATGAVILVEQVMQEAYGKLLHAQRPWKRWEVWAWRAVGYCWVALWWLEILPMAILPGARCHWNIK